MRSTRDSEQAKMQTGKRGMERGKEEERGSDASMDNSE